VRWRDLCVVGARFAGRTAVLLIDEVINLTEPVVHHAEHVYAAADCRSDPRVLSDRVEPDVVAVERHVAVLVNTAL